jgi:protocatechuate 3,4-dioxygenase beta subunit
MACVKRLFNFTLLMAIAFVASLCFIAKAQTADSKPKATASITGRVTIGEKPAPGVTVAVGTMTFPQVLVGQTVSDGEGKYRISGLIPGQISVSAVAPTFVVPASPLSGPGRILNLSADEAVENVDFKLTRGGVITGRATDADGKPVMEERVTLTLLDEKGEPARFAQQPRANPYVYNTDDRGIYRIYGLSAGRYKVSVGDSGGGASLRSGYYQKTYHPDTTDVAKAAIVELSEGSEAKNIDITLASRSRTYTVSGRVIDADTGEPMPGVTYAFGQLQQINGQSMMAGYSSPGTPTNAKGEFRLEGVAPGRYAVTTVRNSFGLDPNQPKVYTDPLPFEVTDGDVSDVELKAHRGLTISGTVVTDAITNKAALAGVSRMIVTSVTMATAGTIQTSSGFITSPIAADGSFQLEGLRPGKVQMGIGGLSTESRGITISRIALNDREVANRQIDLSAAQDVSGVRIYIQFGTGVLRGEVKITGGTLPPDALMMVNLQAENQPLSAGSAQVDSRGHFIMSGIPSGTYDAVLRILALGPNVGNGIPKPLHQSVSVTNDSESQISFTIDLTRKEGP